MGCLTRSCRVALVLVGASVAGSAQDASGATILVGQLGQLPAELDGPAAREALPALRQALDDPSKDVRRFARRAIDTIEQAQP